MSEWKVDNSLMATALNTVTDAVLVMNTDYHILYSNLTAQTIFPGIKDFFDKIHWMKEREVYDFKRNRKLEENETPIGLALTGLKFSDRRVRLTLKETGETRYYSFNGSPIVSPKGRFLGAVIAIRDITSDYLNERTLEREKAFFKNILDLIPAAVFVRDDSKQIIFSNQMYDDLVKDIHKEASENTIFFDNFDEGVRYSLSATVDYESVQWTDGRAHCFRTIRFPIFHQESNKLLQCGIAFDETDRKTIEKRLEEERIKSIGASKLAAIGTLAGEIGHEINNPIAIIKSITFLLRDMTLEGTLDKEVLLEKITTIDATVDRVTKIVRSLKNLSRKVHNESKEPCHLGTIVSDVLSLSDLKFKKRGIILQNIIPKEILDKEVNCYQIQIGEVLMNLLSNAVDAIEDLPGPTVRIEGHEDESFVYLSVYDSGMGVPESMRGKIFDPFFTSKALGKGTGLGLSISRNIMKNHGGDLILDTLKTETCFTMKIPY